MEVLLVDDDRQCQDMVQGTLREDGLTVLSANDGLSGLDAAISEKPDLILADFHLQGIDILDFVKRIRRRAALAETPLILLMPKGETIDPALLQSAGIRATLNKPLDPIVLSREVLQNMGPVVKEEPLPMSTPVTQESLQGGLEAGATFAGHVAPARDTLPAGGARAPDIDKAALQKNILEVVEKVAWDVIPAILETALSKATLQSTVERAVHENVERLLRTGGSEEGDPGSRGHEEALQKNILEVVEKVAWDVIPGVLETALPKETIKAIVERVVWETVPPIAEIEIKKEIKRLQPEEGLSDSGTDPAI